VKQKEKRITDLFSVQDLPEVSQDTKPSRFFVLNHHRRLKVENER
jgi:hypothetical protein